jgi:hypothetical protein
MPSYKQCKSNHGRPPAHIADKDKIDDCKSKVSKKADMKSHRTVRRSGRHYADTQVHGGSVKGASSNLMQPIKDKSDLAVTQAQSANTKAAKSTISYSPFPTINCSKMQLKFEALLDFSVRCFGPDDFGAVTFDPDDYSLLSQFEQAAQDTRENAEEDIVGVINRVTL